MRSFDGSTAFTVVAEQNEQIGSNNTPKKHNYEACRCRKGEKKTKDGNEKKTNED